jgi:glycerophosphoryl diester phosphodiesterase
MRHDHQTCLRVTFRGCLLSIQNSVKIVAAGWTGLKFAKSMRILGFQLPYNSSPIFITNFSPMWLYPKIIAHRGAGIFAPENTLAAMRYAIENGFKGVEFDVMLSGDGVPMLMHDPSFGRTVSGTGIVAETSAAALSLMDAGSWFSPQFVGEPVPYFDTIAHFCRLHRLWMNIEIKPSPGFEAVTGATVAQHTARIFAHELSLAGGSVLDGSARMSLPLLSSFSMDALLASQEVAPALPRALLVTQLTQNWQQQCMAVSAVALHMNHRYVDANVVAQIKQANLGLFCYTVNDRETAARLLAIGVDGFCTDRLDLIKPTFCEDIEKPA